MEIVVTPRLRARGRLHGSPEYAEITLDDRKGGEIDFERARFMTAKGLVYEDIQFLEEDVERLAEDINLDKPVAG